MFLENMHIFDVDPGLLTFYAVLIVLLIAYITLIIVSFIFMFSFNKKVKESKSKINLILYQKYQTLMKIGNEYKSYLDKTNPLFLFEINETFKKFNDLKAEEFEDFYNYSEKILKITQKAYVEYPLNSNSELINELFISINDLNAKYLELIQIYNTYVIGFNYWRNLAGTKWIKKILFIKEKGTIK